MSPDHLIVGALDLVDRAPLSLAHRRGSVFIARQAIEAAVALALGLDDLSRVNHRSRFILLRTERAEDLAREGHSMWSALSTLCHYHPYDLVPSAGDIRQLLIAVRDWLDRMTAAQADATSTSRIKLDALNAGTLQKVGHS